MGPVIRYPFTLSPWSFPSVTSLFLPSCPFTFPTSPYSSLFFPSRKSFVCLCYFAVLLSFDSRLISIQHLCGHKATANWFCFFHYLPNEDREEGQSRKNRMVKGGNGWVEHEGRWQKGGESMREREWQTREICHRLLLSRFNESLSICRNRYFCALRHTCPA